MSKDLHHADPGEYGPYGDSIRQVLELLASDRLFRFVGRLTARYIPVSDLATAQRLTFNPKPTTFHWFEDRSIIWQKPTTPYVMDVPEVRTKFDANFSRLQATIFDHIATQMPKELFDVCYDEVCDDFIGFVKCLASYGELDTVDNLTLEAYRQGGWPCGATGPRPVDEGSGFEDRQMHVYWKGR